MLTIRLQRTGKKNQADFRIVLAEKHKSVSKKFKEILGSFNPRRKLFKVINETRIKELIEQNVNISPTVYNLFISQGLIQGNKVQSFKIKKKKTEENSPDKLKPKDGKDNPAVVATEEETKKEPADKKPIEKKFEDKLKEEVKEDLKPTEDKSKEKIEDLKSEKSLVDEKSPNQLELKDKKE